MRNILGLFLLLAVSVPLGKAAEPAPIRHRFLAIGESRAQVLFVDEANPSANWTLKLPVKSRDYQLIGANRLLLSGGDGYLVYDLATRALVKQFHDKRFAGTASVRRLSNGHTVLGCNQAGISFFELDEKDALVNTALFPDLNTLRLMRFSPTGTMLFGANGHFVVEANLAGKVLARIDVPGKHIYQALRLPTGNLLASTGYGHALVEVDAAGKVLRQVVGSAPLPAGQQWHFFSGYQLLKNGNIVQAHWTGHGANDSTKGPQLVEFDPTGKQVWSWHNPEAAGTIHGVIVLDEVDPAVLNDDASGVLRAL